MFYNLNMTRLYWSADPNLIILSHICISPSTHPSPSPTPSPSRDLSLPTPPFPSHIERHAIGISYNCLPGVSNIVLLYRVWYIYIDLLNPLNG